MNPKLLPGVLCLFCLIIFAPIARAQKWVRVSSRSGGFSVSMPGAPRVLKDDTPGSQTIDYSRSLIEYSVTYFPSRKTTSREATYALLKAGALQTVQARNGRILSQRRFQFNNYPAYETTFIDRKLDRFVKIRIMLVGARAYLLIGSAPRTRKAQIEIDRFHNSFKLLKR